MELTTNLTDEGEQKKLVRFEDERKYIVYEFQEKRRNYSNPEEQVQAEAFLHLVLTYKYPVEHIRQFVAVQMGSETREADIIVYEDDELKSPFIVIECKKPNVSELEFRRAADQAVSYAVAEGARYVWVTSKLKNEYFEIPAKKPKDRITIPDVPQFGVTELARFKFAFGGGTTKNGQKLFPLELVTQDELTRRFQQAHQALWGGGELNPSEAFDELDKLIFCKLWDERKLRKPGEAYDFQVITVKPKDETEIEVRKANEATNQNLLDRLKKLYEEGRKKDPEVFKDDIRLSAAKARTVVSYLESINLSETDLDSKGRAFETFMGSFFRGDFGQYFTPRPIVKFIVDVLPITHESLVLDTSCGSGGFLLHALDKVRQQADGYFPGEDGKGGKKETARHKDHWHNFAENNLYGIEINEQIARTAKMNMIIHDDGHTNVVANDGLVPAGEIRAKTNNQGFKEGRFDFIITNPPFGSSVKLTEKAYMNQYRLAAREVDWLNPKSKAAERPSQDTEILFIEQAWNYLCAGGYLAVVIPDGILTSSSLQYVRDQIEDFFRIVAIISLPQTAFTANGAGVKSSVLFLRKHAAAETKRRRDIKQKLKDSIRNREQLEQKLDTIERKKKIALKELWEREEFVQLDANSRRENESYAVESKAVSERFAAETEDLKFRLLEAYDDARKAALSDYQVFMAIAEDIGYDAVGRPTKTNHLDAITNELVRFISCSEDGRRFDVPDNQVGPPIFCAQFSELTDRFDPEIVRFNREITEFNFPVRQLRELLVEPPQYGAGERGLDRESISQPRYVRITDIDEDGLLIPELGATAANAESQYLLRENDLLIARSGNTVGKAYLHKTELAPYPCFYAGYLIRFRVNESLASPDYIFAFTQLPIFKRWVRAIQRTAGQPNINAQEYRHLPIPVPPKKVQEQIAARFKRARERAMELRHQAIQELERAKNEIEGMIHGSKPTL